jgi:hypothetical protein
MLAGKMLVERSFCNWQQQTMLTITTFDPGFIADTFTPLIAAGGRITLTGDCQYGIYDDDLLFYGC